VEGEPGVDGVGVRPSCPFESISSASKAGDRALPIGFGLGREDGAVLLRRSGRGRFMVELECWSSCFASASVCFPGKSLYEGDADGEGHVARRTSLPEALGISRVYVHSKHPRLTRVKTKLTFNELPGGLSRSPVACLRVRRLDDRVGLPGSTSLNMTLYLSIRTSGMSIFKNGPVSERNPWSQAPIFREGVRPLALFCDFLSVLDVCFRPPAELMVVTTPIS
jgi:hypothetical protein